MGVQPLEPAWSRFQVVPQPSSLATATVVVPAPPGAVNATFSQSGGVVRLQLDVPAGSTAMVCLPPLHPGADGAGKVEGAGVGVGGGDGADTLTVDGKAVQANVWGRMLCTVQDVGAGSHTVTRAQA